MASLDYACIAACPHTVSSVLHSDFSTYYISLRCFLLYNILTMTGRSYDDYYYANYHNNHGHVV